MAKTPRKRTRSARSKAERAAIDSSSEAALPVPDEQPSEVPTGPSVPGSSPSEPASGSSSTALEDPAPDPSPNLRPPASGRRPPTRVPHTPVLEPRSPSSDPHRPVPGNRLPAEWEPHAATWLAWPHQRDDWPGKFGPIPWVYVEIVRQLSRFEPVKVLVNSRREARRAAKQLERGSVSLEQVKFLRVPTDRSWIRDYGPMFVESMGPNDAAQVVVDWLFNGWAKYKNHRRDNRVARRLARRLHLQRRRPRAECDGCPARVVLEGGAIEVNGRGTLMTTEECLLSMIQARNPGLDRAGLERVLSEELGIRHFIWLGRGIAGDDTHGHIDDLARFVDPQTVVAVAEKNPADPNYESLQENIERLRSATDQDGRPLRLVTLPMPGPVVFDGQRLPASYANFYVANGIVLVPTFNDPADRHALGILAELFPGHRVVGIHAVDLVWGLGTLHCLTRDQPAPPAALEVSS